jgi:hypothetical protein
MLGPSNSRTIKNKHQRTSKNFVVVVVVVRNVEVKGMEDTLGASPRGLKS